MSTTSKIQLNAKFQEVIELFFMFYEIVELGHLKPSLCVHMKLPHDTPCFVQQHQQLIPFTRQPRLHDVPYLEGGEISS